MKFLTKCVIASFALCIAFTVAVLVMTAYGVLVPDTLIERFFAVFGIEFGCSAGIKIVKYVVGKDKTEKNVERVEKHNLEVEKSDLLQEKDNESEDIFYG